MPHVRPSLFCAALLAVACTAQPQARTSGTPHKSAAPAATPQLSTAEAAFRDGSAAAANNDLARARSLFQKAVRLAPNVSAAHSALGAVLLALGDAPAALPELERAHQLSAADQQTTISLAVACFRVGDPSRSVSLFRQLPPSAQGTLLNPDEVVAYAGALSATGDPEAARAQLDAALLASPRNASLHDAVGALLAQQQQFAEAATHFQQALALDDTLAVAHLHLGETFLAQGQPSQAVTEISRAAQLDPANTSIAIRLGRALSADGQDEKAIAVLRDALTRQPSSIAAKYALALALQAGGDPRQALPLFQQVAAARPADAEALTNYALALVQTGDAKSAIPIYQQAFQGGDNPTLREDLGVAYLQISDLDHSIEQFRKGLALDPANPHLHYDLGLAYKLKDDVKSSIDELQQAEALDASLPDPPYTLGVLYMQLGRFSDAEAQLQKAVSLRDRNGEAWSLLANVYKESGQIDKAKVAITRAAELLPEQPAPHITLAAMLAQQGDSTGAAAERKKAADLSRAAYSRQRASFALESGRALLKRGKAEEATVQLQTAITADPNSSEAHLLLAQALALQGRPADAALERRKGRDLASSTPSAAPASGARP